MLLALAVPLTACAHRPSPSASSSAKPALVAPLLTYGSSLHALDQASPEVTAAIADATDTLSRVTGATFSAADARGTRGIVLVKAKSASAADADVKRLTDRGPEAFVIRSTDSASLTITANADTGLINGLYYYLQRIGCRWFFPGDAWTVLPKRRDITLRVDDLVVPAFRMRSFAGTGGFGGATPVDPSRAMAARWDLWKRRNGFGGEFALGGHTYEAFNTAHRQVLEQHPEYRALVNGKRAPWSVITKLCVSNPELVALYTEDRLSLFRRQVAAAPDGPQSFAVSVDPSDGGGFCECDRCRSIGTGSASDQAFHLANQVAKAVAKEMPGRRVSLYAYLDHAAVPTIPLEPNVYVSVIPEALQRTGLSSEEFIAAWRKRVSPLSLYTYWSIPDWNADLPTFDFTNIPRQKIRYWHDHGIEGVNFETTFSAGAMGIGLYLASRLLWDPSTDDQALLGEFYELAFGPARAPMQKMLERWAQAFTLSDYEIGLSLRDLADARKAAAARADVTRRLDDYETYVRYLSQWLEYQDAPLNTPERLARGRAVMLDVYDAYASAMIDSNRIQQLVAERYEKGSPLRGEFDPKNAEAPGWKMLREASAKPKGLAASYHAVDLPRVRLSNDLVPLPRSRLGAGDPLAASALLFGGPMDFEVEVPAGQKSLDFAIKVQKTASAPGDAVVVRRPDGVEALREVVPADGEAHSLSVALGQSGRYVIHVEDQKTTFFFSPPTGLPTVFRTFASPWPSPPVYFLVPKGLRRVAMFAHGSVPIEIHDADGRQVSAPGGRVVMFDVPSGQDGRVWSFRNFKGWEPVRMLNAPQVFALSRDALLVPRSELR